jgi:Amt family ammonium transporter
VKQIAGLRLSQEDEYKGADLAIHRIGSTNSDNG